MARAAAPDPALMLPGRIARRALALWALVCAGAIVGLQQSLLPGQLSLSLPVFVTVAALCWVQMPLHYPFPRAGLCNAVTLLRAALVAALAAMLAPTGTAVLPWAVPAVALVALALDGVDGWLARRSGLVSDFGARFDMEVDALLALVLALLALQSGTVGTWVLLLGGLRYLYVAAGRVWPWLTDPLPQRFRRKAVCVLQIAVLILLLVPGVGGPGAVALGLAATGLLVWSFALDILWLARRQ